MPDIGWLFLMLFIDFFLIQFRGKSAQNWVTLNLQKIQSNLNYKKMRVYKSNGTVNELNLLANLLLTFMFARLGKKNLNINLINVIKVLMNLLEKFLCWKFHNSTNPELYNLSLHEKKIQCQENNKTRTNGCMLDRH